MAEVFVSGGTGFMGQSLLLALMTRGHGVTALARPGSEGRIPPGVKVVSGNPLESASFMQHVGPSDTYVHLLGVSKPAPWKEQQFRAIDLVSLRESLAAARAARVRHFVYVSVAQPAPVMKSYVRVRQECEAFIRESGIPATILRPWYVLGPGRKWPLLLAPFYRMMEAAGSETAVRLGLVTLDEMIGALVWAVDHPGTWTLDVPAIRRFGSKD